MNRDKKVIEIEGRVEFDKHNSEGKSERRRKEKSIGLDSESFSQNFQAVGNLYWK